MQIRWNQVNLRDGLIVLEARQTKNKKARTIPLPDVLVEMLGSVVDKDGAVFDGTNLRKAWNKTCVQVGLGKFTEVPGKPYDPRIQALSSTTFAAPPSAT